MARRWRWPVDRPSPRSPSSVAYWSGRAATKSCANAASAARCTSASVACGRPRRMLSATVPANRCGRCGTYATRLPPGGRVEFGEVDAVDGDPARLRRRRSPARPGAACSCPRRSVRRARRVRRARPSGRTRRGPACGRPRTARRSPRPRSGPGPAPSVPHGAVASPRAAFTWSRTVRPSAAAWKRVPSSRSGRYASGARSSTSSAVRRPIEPSSSRRPAGTATSATDSVAVISSTNEDRNAMRSVRTVARRWASAIASTTSVCARVPAVRAQGRQARDDVEEVAAEPVQQPPLAFGGPPGLPVRRAHRRPGSAATSGR